MKPFTFGRKYISPNERATLKKLMRTIRAVSAGGHVFIMAPRSKTYYRDDNDTIGTKWYIEVGYIRALGDIIRINVVGVMERSKDPRFVVTNSKSFWARRTDDGWEITKDKSIHKEFKTAIALGATYNWLNINKAPITIQPIPNNITGGE